MREAVSRSHQGRRSANEDAVVVSAEVGLCLVADGMGGHRGGGVASRIVADTVSDFVQTSLMDAQITWPFGLEVGLSLEANSLKNAVRLANQRVQAEGRRQPECEGMGSTVVAGLFSDTSLVHTNVGDSRLYLIRSGELKQLTTDDSWAASMLRAGADEGTVKQHPMRHVLTRVVGMDDSLDVEVSKLALEPGDLLVFSSDGLHGPLSDPEILVIASDQSRELEARADALVESALGAGGTDNVSVVLVRLDGSSGKAQS